MIPVNRPFHSLTGACRSSVVRNEALLQASHQEQVRQVALEGRRTSLPVRRQSQWSKKLSSRFRSLHHQPRLFAMSGDIETADLDVCGFALL
jgi:hypothetical protein